MAPTAEPNCSVEEARVGTDAIVQERDVGQLVAAGLVLTPAEIRVDLALHVRVYLLQRESSLLTTYWSEST